jgi:hypothetical protein
MRTDELARSLGLLFAELVDGAPPTGAFMLNPGDPGLLRSLERLSAADASMSRSGGASIAAHVAHLTYGLSLLNRWAGGEEPFHDADWSAAWKTSEVSAEEWSDLRAGVAREAERWQQALTTPRDASGVALHGMIGSVAHLAYHLGAIRQISATARGPRDGSSPEQPVS